MYNLCLGRPKVSYPVVATHAGVLVGTVVIIGLQCAFLLRTLVMLARDDPGAVCISRAACACTVGGGGRREAADDDADDSPRDSKTTAASIREQNEKHRVAAEKKAAQRAEAAKQMYGGKNGGSSKDTMKLSRGNSNDSAMLERAKARVLEQQAAKQAAGSSSAKAGGKAKAGKKSKGGKPSKKGSRGGDSDAFSSNPVFEEG